MNQTELKEFLDYKADTFENSSFLESDPITLPHRFQNKEDIEITAFLIATIAWGNRKSIIQSGERILEIMEYQPKEFILSFDSQNKLNSRFVHRTFNSEDLHYFFARLNHIYKEGGLEHSFRKSKPNDTVKERIHLFRTRFFGNDTEHRSFKHVSDPMKNSAAKRLNMFLRWIKLGLLSRKQDDWKALEELMTELRKMDSNDPVKYDFALFGLGAFESF